MYAEKRRELRELELLYRKEMDKQLKKAGGFKEKMRTNNEIIEELLRQIEENQKQVDYQNSIHENLADKIEEQKNLAGHKDQEIDELKRQIESKADEGE